MNNPTEKIKEIKNNSQQTKPLSDGKSSKALKSKDKTADIILKEGK